MNVLHPQSLSTASIIVGMMPLLADVEGGVYVALSAIILFAVLVALWFASGFAPRGTVLALAACTFILGNIINPGETRALHLLVAFTKFGGFIGIVLGVVDAVRKRGSTQRPGSRPQRSPGGRVVLICGICLAVLFMALVGIAIVSRGVLRSFQAETVVAAGPYALDDPQARTRMRDGSLDASPSNEIAFMPLAGQRNIVFATTVLHVPAGHAGYKDELRIYEPSGPHDSRSLGCILVTAAGGSLLVGSPPPNAADEREWLPYVKAGFAVVAFRQDGEVDSAHLPSNLDLVVESKSFLAAQAGLTNARNALEFVIARMNEVDPQRIYVAGHSSAATLALLFAEHEARIRACIAYAPVVNVSTFLQIAMKARGSELSAELAGELAKISPATHASKFSCPVWLFHAEGDRFVPIAESRSFVQQLKAAGKNATLASVPGG
ncbi:MAG TPA: prolyl oligopeptidase family serine peptidase, partial [Pirellulales bacterium]|nr:prolyl oligopeptidase family serine peptidase [Pirellulales bacterium]